MELHILGPAFGLPSIDAECNAAVALLRLRSETDWTLIPTHDQTRHLPYLRDGDNFVEGYRNISRHISNQAGNRARQLQPKQQADATALASFIFSHAQTLLDISLYVSADNYSTTRSAFTKILPWYSNYILPPARRNAARTRTNHLGINSIDVDDVHEDLSNRPPGLGDVGKEKSFESKTQERASLLLPSRNTVSGLLRRREHSAVFKLHALADNFFEPLQEMLGENEYFLGRGEMSEVDCLAYGYLSLMIYPDLPHSWLKTTLKTKYVKLVQFVDRMHQRLQIQTKVEDVMVLAYCTNEQEVVAKRKRNNMTLPWTTPASTTIVDAASIVSSDLSSRIPLLGSSTTITTSPPTKYSYLQQHFPTIIAATATTLGLLGYYAFATGLLEWPRGQELQIFGRKRFSDYGHLGAALAGMSMIGRQVTRSHGMVEQESGNIPIGVEVEVERDGPP